MAQATCSRCTALVAVDRGAEEVVCFHCGAQLAVPESMKKYSVLMDWVSGNEEEEKERYVIVTKLFLSISSVICPFENYEEASTYGENYLDGQWEAIPIAEPSRSRLIPSSRRRRHKVR